MPNNNKDYYKTLGVEKTASQDEIKSAYRKLAKQYHPDLHPGDEASAQKFKEINEAYEVLGDENKRKNYDQYGSADPNMFGGGFGGGSPFGAGGFEGSFGSFGDIFGDLFSSFGGRGRGGATIVTPGEDISINVNLSFKEAVFGCEKTIKVNKLNKCSSCSGTGARDGTRLETCPDCHGTGQVRYTQNSIFGQVVSTGPCKTCNATGKIIKEKCPDCSGKGTIREQEEVTLKIPAGIDNNQVITMRGRGNASTRNGPNGNLEVNISVTPHPILERSGFDLLLDLPIPFTKAYLGTKVTIPTPDGDYELTIPSLTQPNTVMRLKGKGVPKLQREGRGDLVVTIRVEMPKEFSKKDKDLIETLDNNISPNAYKKVKTFQDKMDRL